MRLTSGVMLWGRGISGLVLGLALLIGATAASAAPLFQAAPGQICVQAFEDKNDNGTHDSDEPLLSGVGFTLADANGFKSSYTSDGSSEPYCFGKLDPGTYTVHAKASAAYESTTVGQWAISLASGAQYDVRYGAKRTGSDAAPSGNSAGSPPSTSSGPTPLGRIVLGGLGVLILLGAGFMAGTIVQHARNQ